MPFILYAIYPFLKSGTLYVNSITNDFYLGSGENKPVKLVTELNIDDYVTGGDNPGGGDHWFDGFPGYNGRVYTWYDKPVKTDIKVGNYIEIATLPLAWCIVTHVTSTEAYLTECGTFETCSFDALPDMCAHYDNFVSIAQ